MQRLGDKVAAKENAITAGLPVIEDSREPLDTVEIARREADRIGYPLMLKAASGGGGRGMRVLRDPSQLEGAYHDARNEALKAFGDATVFLEKYIDSPKHIEIQILGIRTVIWCICTSVIARCNAASRKWWKLRPAPV